MVGRPRPSTYTGRVLFGKKKDPVEATAPSDSAPVTTDPSRPQGKGRPTPKRRDAEAANRRPLVQDTKGRTPAEKERIRAERMHARDMMMRGEEKYLPERDRGPERRYLRDAVDRRWNVGEVLLPLMILLLAVSFLPFDWARSVLASAYLLIVFLIADAWLLWRRTKKQFATAFGFEAGKGSAAYVIMRSFQMRMSRVPRPAVKRGDPLVRR